MSSKVTKEGAALAVAGNLISLSEVNITNLYINQPGPLPLTGYFTSSGGALIIFVSGSGRVQSASGGAVSMTVTLDGSSTPLGSCEVTTNLNNSHSAMIPVCFFVAASGQNGQHTITLTANNSTVTDFNDWFNVTIVEAVPS